MSLNATSSVDMSIRPCGAASHLVDISYPLILQLCLKTSSVLRHESRAVELQQIHKNSRVLFRGCNVNILIFVKSVMIWLPSSANIKVITASATTGTCSTHESDVQYFTLILEWIIKKQYVRKCESCGPVCLMHVVQWASYVWSSGLDTCGPVGLMRVV